MTERPDRIKPFVDQFLGFVKEQLARYYLNSGKYFQFLQNDPYIEVFPFRILRYEHICNEYQVSIPLAEGDYTPIKDFREQMLAIKRLNVIYLHELFELISSKKKIPHGTVCIVLEGGFVDQFENACPILSELKLPTTIFVPTDFIGTNKLYWHDAIVYLLVALEVRQQPMPELSFLPEEFSEMIYSLCGPEKAITIPAINALRVILDNSTMQLQMTALSSILEALKVFDDILIPKVFMDWNELKQVASLGFAIGSLTHNFYKLTELTPSFATSEIVQSMVKLITEGITPNKIIAAPSGAIPPNFNLLLKNLKLSGAIGSNILLDGLQATPPILPYVAISKLYAPQGIATFMCKVWQMRVMGVEI